MYSFDGGSTSLKGKTRVTLSQNEYYKETNETMYVYYTAPSYKYYQNCSIRDSSGTLLRSGNFNVLLSGASVSFSELPGLIDDSQDCKITIEPKEVSVTGSGGTVTMKPSKATVLANKIEAPSGSGSSGGSGESGETFEPEPEPEED